MFEALSSSTNAAIFIPITIMVLCADGVGEFVQISAFVVVVFGPVHVQQMNQPVAAEKIFLAGRRMAGPGYAGEGGGTGTEL